MSLKCAHPKGLCGKEYDPSCACCAYNEDPEIQEVLDIHYTAILDKQIGGSHYTDMKIQPVEFIVANKLEYRVGNVIKYACRHANKNGVEDINKAIHYLEMIKETDYAD